MSNAILSWRDFASERGTLSVTAGAFESAAPVTNLLTPRTSQLAITTSDTTGVGVRCTLDSGPGSPGLPVHLFALLNHNVVGTPDPFDVAITLTDANANVATLALPFSGTLSFALDYQSHLFFVVPKGSGVDRDHIVRVEFNTGPTVQYGRRDPFTGVVTPESFRAGGFWCGPMWQPDNGLRFDGFGQGVSEQPRKAVSIGGQVYASPAQRFRTLNAEFTLLTEREVYAANPGVQLSLQQLAAWCCVSRPLIVIPTDSSDELVYTMGLYGFLNSPMSWGLADSAVDPQSGQKVRSYRASLQMTEAL